MSHQSVLLQEVLKVFESSLQTFVDCTLGAGGHAYALLKAHPEIKRFIGFDQDPDAQKIASEKLEPWKEKITIVASNFKDLDKYVKEPVDGILMDLGISSMQLDMPEKGFSFMREGPLDMRMDPTGPLTAQEIVNTFSEQELGRIFRDYGEEKQWRLASRAIVQARQKKPLQTTKSLADILYPVLLPKSKKGIHPATLIFQGLRIFVNQELEVLSATLPQAVKRLKKGGRLAVISFHSLEDRIVKNYFRYEAEDKENTSGIGGMFLDKKPGVRLITRQPIEPTDEEILKNPRSRSAKLRVVERLC